MDRVLLYLAAFGGQIKVVLTGFYRPVKTSPVLATATLYTRHSQMLANILIYWHIET